MKSRTDVAAEIVAHVGVMKDIVDNVVPELVSTFVVETNGNAGEVRKIARTIAPAVSGMQTVKEWHVGMTTNPGDIVCKFDDPTDYCYIFTGDNPMQHNNPTFYPGAAGVYYWAIIPKVLDGYLVYPNVEGIIVAVRKGDIWYDTNGEHLYEFIGEDNDNCVWAPGTADTLWKPYNLKGE